MAGGPGNVDGVTGPSIEQTDYVPGSAFDFIFEASNNLAAEEQGIRDLAVNVLHPMNNITQHGLDVLTNLGTLEEQAEASGGLVTADNEVVEEALGFLLLAEADFNTLTGEITYKNENGDTVTLTDQNGDKNANYTDLLIVYDKDGDGKLSGDELAEKFAEFDADGDGKLNADELDNLINSVQNGIESFQTLSNSFQQELQYRNGEYTAKWEAFFGGVKAWLDAMRTPANNAR